MDFFLEANWYMNFTGVDSGAGTSSIPAKNQDLYKRTWYKEFIQKKLVQPRLPRFRELTGRCLVECQTLLGYRLSPDSPGYGPFLLLADIGNMV